MFSDKSHRAQYAEEKKKGIQMANQLLTDAIERHFTEQYNAMREQILKTGINDPQQINKIIQRVKWKTQIDCIKQFKRELEIEIKQNPKHLSHPEIK